MKTLSKKLAKVIVSTALLLNLAVPAHAAVLGDLISEIQSLTNGSSTIYAEMDRETGIITITGWVEDNELRNAVERAALDDGATLVNNFLHVPE